MSVHDEVYTFLKSLDLELPHELNDQTRLFETGLFDSLALFNLTIWIEQRTGRPIEPAKFDLTQEWATVDDIVRFIEGRQTQDRTIERNYQISSPYRSPGDDYEVIKYSPEFKMQLAELQKELWSPDVDLNIRFFEWKYERNPYSSGEPLIFLALHRGELVGMRGFAESRWQIGSRIEPFLVADDLVIRNDYRNRGLFTHIMDVAFADLAENGFDHALSLSASPANVFGSLTMGWKSVGVLKPMGTPERGNRFRKNLRSVIRKSPVVWRGAEASFVYSTSEREPFKKFDAAIARNRKDEGNGITFDTKARVCEMEALVNRESYDGRIRHLRDHEYLNWRYENPRSEYRFVYAGGEQLDGYLAMSRPVAGHAPSGRVTIMDIEARNNGTFIEIVSAVASLVDGLYIWTATMSESRRSKLRDLGFVPVDHERTSRGCPCILVRPLSGPDGWDINGRPLLDMTAWDIRTLYSMNV